MMMMMLISPHDPHNLIRDEPHGREILTSLSTSFEILFFKKEMKTQNRLASSRP
jgi:hypothetical protein